MERRIQDIANEKLGKTYNTKPTTGKFNVHYAKYTADQIAYVQEVMADYIYFFNYVVAPEGKTPNPTGVFDYKNTKPELEAVRNGFIKSNEDAHKLVLERVGKDVPTPKYNINGDKDCFKLVNEEESSAIQFPGRDFAHKKFGYGGLGDFEPPK